MLHTRPYQRMDICPVIRQRSQWAIQKQCRQTVDKAPGCKCNLLGAPFIASGMGATRTNDLQQNSKDGRRGRF